MGGLRLPWLGSRVSVPSQKLRSGPGGESAKSEPLDQWPVTRPGPLRFVEKNPTKMEISETQVKRLLGGREYSTCGQTRGQAQRHSCPRGSLNHLCGAFPLGFLWPVILLCRVLSLCWVFQRLPCWLPRWLSGRESACSVGDPGSIPWVGKIPWRRKWPPTSVFLPGSSLGQRSLVDYI